MRNNNNNNAEYLEIGDGIVSDLKSMKLSHRENNKSRKKVGLTKWV